MKSKIEQFIKREEKWASIEPPKDLHFGIMKKIYESEIRKQSFMRKYLWKILTASLGLMIIIAAGLFYFMVPREIEVYFVYPYAGETTVDVVGNFNQWTEKVPMELDKLKNVWQAKIHLDKKGVYEYQFIINGTIYTAGAADEVIVDENGEKKGVLVIL